MRGQLDAAAVVVGAFVSLSLGGCNHTSDSLLGGQPQDEIGLPARGDGAGVAPEGSPAAVQAACAGVAAPTMLATTQSVRDVRIVGDAVFYQAGPKVMRVTKDGKDSVAVFTSPNLLRVYVDKNALITIESTDDAPDATLRVIKATNADDASAAFPEFPATGDAPAGGTAPALPAPGDARNADPTAAPPAPAATLPGTTAATNFNAAGTAIFASDDTSFYALADTAAGNALVKISKDAPGTQTTVLAMTNSVGHPQLVGKDIWYVRDEASVFKVTMGDDGAAAGDAVDMFDVTDASCNLTVAGTSAYCSLGTTVQRRDLSGKNPITLVDPHSAKTTVPLGGIYALDSAIYLPTQGPDPKFRSVIVGIQSAESPATQKFVACGRGDIGSVAVDGSSVAWAEAGGVFIAPR